MTPKMLVSKIRAIGRMSQSEVAEAAGVPQSMISKLERGTVTDIMSKSYVSLMELYVSLQDMEKERRVFVSRLTAKK